jgi:hypothetical protein
MSDQDCLTFSCTVSKPFGWLDPALDWCRREVGQEWKWQLIESSTDQAHGVYRFYFSSLQDFVAFTMFK